MEFNSEISFRRCNNNETDMRLIFDWSNDEEVRKNSFSTNKINLDDHKRWFQSKMIQDNYHILFCMVADKEIGLARLEIQDNIALLSYQIAKDYRGMGYGTKMLKNLEKYVLDNKIASVLYGEVKESNPSSQKIFEKLDYKKNIDKDIIKYTKELFNK